MIIIDLAEELWQGWKAHDGFYGKKWIYSVIHNFGGNNPMNGPLKFFAENPSKATSASNKGALVGMGLSAEGVENNEVIYELLTDVEWQQNGIDLDRWLEEYCASRYGSCPEAMKKSWQLLVKSIYTKPEGNVRFGFQKQPSLVPRGEAKAGPEFEEALQLYLSCAGQLRGSKLYQYDLVELITQYTGVTVDSLLRKAGEFYRQSKFNLQDTVLTQSVRLMNRMDELLASRNDRRLERWINYARQWGKTDKEKNYYEMDARRQVTVWGGPVLSEYAAKVWSGLIRDYYAQRWKLYYQDLKNFAKPDLGGWEEQWITTPGNLSRQTPVRDIVTGAAKLKAEVDGIKDTLFPLK
jgi:alpha-N-acetylglucosaminidase